MDPYTFLILDLFTIGWCIIGVHMMMELWPEENSTSAHWAFRVWVENDLVFQADVSTRNGIDPSELHRLIESLFASYRVAKEFA